MNQKIAILLATYNGAKYLRAQIQSFADQSLRPDWVVISDDGSNDSTVQVIDSSHATLAPTKVQIHKGPERGHKANFAYLLSKIPSDVTLVALSDQDDVWLPEKLQNAARKLEDVPKGTPALYGSRTLHVNNELTYPRPSPLLSTNPCFEHAITQNFAGGNTMILNAAAIDIVRYALPKTPIPVHHDWWLYQLISGCGGTIIYDPEPSLLYRQHRSNAIGANDGLLAATLRAFSMLKGQYFDWNNANFAAMDAVRDKLTPQACQTLDLAKSIRQKNFFARISALGKSKIHRSTWIGQLGLIVSVAVKRF